MNVFRKLKYEIAQEYLLAEQKRWKIGHLDFLRVLEAKELTFLSQKLQLKEFENNFKKVLEEKINKRLKESKAIKNSRFSKSFEKMNVKIKNKTENNNKIIVQEILILENLIVDLDFENDQLRRIRNRLQAKHSHHISYQSSTRSFKS